MKKMILVVLIVALSLLGGDVLAEWDYSPGKFANDGMIGKKKRLRQIYTRDLNVSGMQIPGIVVVDDYADLTAIGGASVYVVDLTLGNEFRIDVEAIYQSTLPTLTTGLTPFSRNQFSATSGVTVVSPTPTVENTGTMFSIIKWDSAVTPVGLWTPQTTGVTALATVYSMTPWTRTGLDATSGASEYRTVAGVSDYQLYEQFDRRTYQLAYNEVSGNSIFNARLPVAHKVSQHPDGDGD